MGMFGEAIEGLKAKFAENAEQKKQEQMMLRRMRLEAQEVERQAFEKHFKENARIVAEARAKQEAAKASGLQKLRAINRARNLSQSEGTPGGFFDKLAGYTQRNLANRDSNIKKTQELREAAKKMREDRLAKLKAERELRMARAQSRKSFNKF